MGLKPSEFYKMTPREFFVYHEQQINRINDENENADRRAALIAHIIANVNRDSKKKRKPWTIEDFMPKKASKEKEKKKVQSPEIMAEVLKAIVIANGGEVIG